MLRPSVMASETEFDATKSTHTSLPFRNTAFVTNYPEHAEYGNSSILQQILPVITTAEVITESSILGGIYGF